MDSSLHSNFYPILLFRFSEDFSISIFCRRKFTDENGKLLDPLLNPLWDIIRMKYMNEYQDRKKIVDDQLLEILQR